MIAPKYIETLYTNLDKIPITFGNIILVSDRGEYYYDTSDNKRINVGCIILLEKEADRESIIAPLTNKIYLVAETKSLYIYYNSAWISMSSGKIETCVIQVLLENWTLNEECMDMYDAKITHTLKSTNVSVVVYNAAKRSEFVAITVVDDSTIMLHNIKGIDCKVIIR